ncbi:hypothetical protein NPIL_612271 [Nephila pilipes]|uniref:Uncharacterized protein n=1 Tax=Nephila pilipes TaxID=299642 RepID=A0A8X6JU70_NEPPI|nr:hypothetical protein NPIL_612271 [Nephila pilipes]
MGEENETKIRLFLGSWYVMKAFTNPCRTTWSNASVLSGTQTGRTVDEGAAGKVSIVSESGRATDKKAPNHSSFYTVPDRMGAELASPTLLTCDKWDGWESEGACSCLESLANYDTRCDCSTDTSHSPLSHGETFQQGLDTPLVRSVRHNAVGEREPIVAATKDLHPVVVEKHLGMGFIPRRGKETSPKSGDMISWDFEIPWSGLYRSGIVRSGLLRSGSCGLASGEVGL